MASPPKKRLLCDPFEFNFRLHVFGGFWPLETTVRWKQILFSIFSFLCYFSLTSMVTIQAADIYLLRNDPVRLTEDLCSIASAYTIVIKSLLIQYKVDDINRLKKKFTEYKRTRTNPAHVEILENSDRHILTMMRTFYTVAVPCVVFWTLYPGLDSGGHRKVPFPYLLPVEEWTFGVWVGLYVYQSLAMVGYLFNVLATDGMFCGFALRIAAHYNIIIHNLKGLNGEEVEKELKNNVELHKDILRDMKVLEKIYSPPFLIHAGGVIVIIGTAIIDFVRIGRNLNFQMLQKLLYVTGGVWDTFLYCYCCSEVHQKSLAMSAAVYAIPWYDLKPKVRKDLIFITLKCQKVPKIRVAHLFQLDLKAFVNVLKTSYDLTALLFRAVKE